MGRRNDPKDSGGYEDNCSADGARPEYLSGTVFVPGDRMPFGCAVFDGTSDRHAYALPVYWMVFDR